jgi:ferritin
MLSNKVQDAMNEQLHVELESAYVYLGMSAFFETQGLPGMAAWMRRQFDEEQQHAFKIYNFILDRNAKVELKKLEAPEVSYGSPLQVFESALAHEQKVTASINRLYELVAKEKDFASQALLDWFATEQVEEEKTVGQIIDDLKRIGGDGNGLFLLDKDLGTRTPDE